MRDLDGVVVGQTVGRWLGAEVHSAQVCCFRLRDCQCTGFGGCTSLVRWEVHSAQLWWVLRCKVGV